MILIVAATSFEIANITKGISVTEGEVVSVRHPNGFNFCVLVTGVGAAPTAYHLGKALVNNNFRLIVNLGIAGAYSKALAIGDVTLVTHDVFADYGIDDNGQFKTLSQLLLVNPNSFPYTDGWLVNPSDELIVNKTTSHLKKVKAITVSTATGSTPLVEKWSKLYNPDIETMEGAAVFYSCLQAKKPFICLRAISNRVEPRNKDAWNIPLALKKISVQAEELLQNL